MIYCNTCLYPETKPDIWFDEKGKCSACLAFEENEKKDWALLEKEFIEIVKQYKAHSTYDVIVPVSGGKDSTFQVLKMLELGFNPLAVNARTDELTNLGRQNLDNISELGVDVIEVNTNRKVRRRIARYGLETVGDISYGEHLSIFSLPFSIACEYGIPLIVWGENSQNCYGAGPKGTESAIDLDEQWLSEFGGLNGLRVNDLIDTKVATEKELYQYIFPTGYKWDIVQPRGIFLGQFFKWDGLKNANLARNNGFKFNYARVECSGFYYENLDSAYTGIHDRLKYVKYGFGRATDIVSSHIRHGYTTREKGIDHVNVWDNCYPNKYLDISLEETLSKLGLDKNKYNSISDKFTNKELFEIPRSGYVRAKFEIK